MNKILLHITDNEIRIKNNNNEIIINENGMNINNILHIKEQTITNVDSTNGLIELKSQNNNNITTTNQTQSQQKENTKQEDSNQQQINEYHLNDIIRIETQDDSDEFIEIIFDKYSEQLDSGEIKPLLFPITDAIAEGISSLLPDNNEGLLGTALNAMASIKNPKNLKNVNKTTRLKSLSREEVLKIVDRLPKGLKSNGQINDRVRLVKNKKELDVLWERLIKGARKLPNGLDKRHNKPILRRELDDRTQVNYRIDSKSGGETIDINSRNPKTNIKIHTE